MIGVAVSTHQRPQILSEALENWDRYQAPGCSFRVVEDVSGAGVAITKNRGIAALMDDGVEHLFLVDDDCWPKAEGWWLPYVEDPMPHLMYCWGGSRRTRKQGRYSYWTHPRGVMLYLHRSVIETVGGMRTEFGRKGHEHVEYSRRIHNAGFTPEPFMDLRISGDVWHALDRRKPGESLTALGDRRKSLQTAGNSPDTRHLLDLYKDSAQFVEYRT